MRARARAKSARGRCAREENDGRRTSMRPVRSPAFQKRKARGMKISGWMFVVVGRMREV